MRKSSTISPPSLSIRIDLDTEGRIGPGKIRLLENIRACGSISAAGRAMDMSYKRAWDLVDEINRICRRAAVERQVGGKNGGGAVLTPLASPSSRVTGKSNAPQRARPARSFLRCGRTWLLQRKPEPLTGNGLCLSLPHVRDHVTAEFCDFKESGSTRAVSQAPSLADRGQGC
jgi:molybdate transport repressor ModE-like protein